VVVEVEVGEVVEEEEKVAVVGEDAWVAWYAGCGVTSRVGWRIGWLFEWPANAQSSLDMGPPVLGRGGSDDVSCTQTISHQPSSIVNLPMLFSTFHLPDQQVQRLYFSDCQ
jgi:hypothetical protein